VFVADSKRLTHAGAKKNSRHTAVAKARQAGIAILGRGLPTRADI